MNLKEKHLEVKEWLSAIEKEKLDLFKTLNSWSSYGPSFQSVRYIKYWYDNIDEYDPEIIQYIFGEKRVSVEDISKHMLAHISSFEKDVEDSKKQWIKDYGSIDTLDEEGMSFEEYFSEDKRDSGYAGIEQYNEVKKFWQTLTEYDISCVISGELDDIDLNGYRHYWLDHSKIEPLLFNFVQYRDEPLDIELYNSNDVYDLIESFKFPNFELPSVEDFNKSCEEAVKHHNNSREENFKYEINNLIKKFDGDELFKYRIEKLKSMI